jgi:hypothetical protein
MRNLAVLVALALVGACTPLLAGGDLCPPGRGPAPLMDFPLAMAQNRPVAVTVRAGFIYWINQGPAGTPEGEVKRVDLCSRTLPTALAASQPRPTALLVDGEAIYWANEGLADGQGEVWRANLDGSGASQLASAQDRPSALAVDASAIYWTSLGARDPQGFIIAGTGSVWRLDRGGTLKRLVDRRDAPSAIAVRDGVVYFTEAGAGAIVDLNPAGPPMPTPTVGKGSGTVQRIATDGTLTALATGADDPVALTVDGDGVLWLDRGVFPGSGALWRSSAGATGSVRGGLDFPTAFVRDGDAIYVSVTGAEDETREGRVARVGLVAQDLVDFAVSQQLPRGVALDGNLVYWVDYGTPSTTDGVVLARFK